MNFFLPIFASLCVTVALYSTDDCLFKVVEGPGLDGSGEVTGVASGLGGCCSEAAYYMRFDGDRRYEVEVTDLGTGDRARFDLDPDGGFYWFPPSGCGGPWLIQAYGYVAELGEFYPVLGAHVTVLCEEACE